MSAWSIYSETVNTIHVRSKILIEQNNPFLYTPLLYIHLNKGVGQRNHIKSHTIINMRSRLGHHETALICFMQHCNRNSVWIVSGRASWVSRWATASRLISAPQQVSFMLPLLITAVEAESKWRKRRGLTG